MGLFNWNRKQKEEEPENPLPVSEDERRWLDHAFAFLLHQFDRDKFLSRTMLLPTKAYFNYRFDGDKDEVRSISRHIAELMEINPDDIQLEYYSGGMEGIYLATGDALFMGYEGEGSNFAGQYLDLNEEGKYIIALSERVLQDPVSLIATLAHEYGHIKLLGEGRIEENDEHLTDMVPLFFGLGLFNAISSFTFSKDFTKWKENKMGYLNPMEWGYLLALFTYVRNEEPTDEQPEPEWLNFVNEDMKKDYRVSLEWILNNEELVLQPPAE